MPRLITAQHVALAVASIVIALLGTWGNEPPAGPSAQWGQTIAHASSESTPDAERSISVADTVVIRGTTTGGRIEVLLPGCAFNLATKPGWRPLTLIRQMVDSINVFPLLKMQSIVAKAVADSAFILDNVGEYAVGLCSSDSGLRLPDPPQEVHCYYDSTFAGVVISWRLPGARYDRIHVTLNGVPVAENLAGGSTEYVHRFHLVISADSCGECEFSIIGVRGNTPSCPARCLAIVK